MKRVFQGRLNRRNYIVATITIFIIAIILALAFIVLAFSRDSGPSTITNITTSLWFLIFPALFLLVLCTISLNIRRLHDMNINGWVSLLMFAPYVGAVLPLILAISPGTEGSNKYGRQPKSILSFKTMLIN